MAYPEPVIKPKPKHVNAELQGPLLYPVNQEPWQQPLWGLPVVQLRDGGDPWPRKITCRCHLNDKGLPRRLAQGKEFYPGEFHPDEPDPAVSCRCKTGQLVRAMWRASWSRQQAEDALTNPNHLGGAYYRWRAFGDKDPDAFLDYLWTETAQTDTHPYYAPAPCNSGPPGGTAITRKEDTWVYQPEVGESVLDLVGRLPTTSQAELCSVLVASVAGVHPRNVRKYLRALEGLGRVRASTQTVTTKVGKRTCKVWSAVLSLEELAAPGHMPPRALDLEALLSNTYRPHDGLGAGRAACPRHRHADPWRVTGSLLSRAARDSWRRAGAWRREGAGSRVAVPCSPPVRVVLARARPA